MGNSNQSYSSNFHERYEFVDMVKDHNFGMVKVYRKRQLNFDYVMILDKYLAEQEVPRVKQELAYMYRAFLNLNDPMILRILHYEVHESSFSECRMPLVRIYIEYLNFTLKNLLQKNWDKNTCINYDQILYIVHCVLETYAFLQKINSGILSLKIDTIFITPEGLIKFSPIKIKDYVQEQGAFCRALCNGSNERTKMNMVSEKSDKQLLIEIKKLVSDLTKQFYSNSKMSQEQKKVHELLLIINQARSIGNLRRNLESSGVECLQSFKKDSEEEINSEMDTSLYKNSGEHYFPKEKINKKKKTRPDYT